MRQSKQFCCWLLLGAFVGSLNGFANTNNFVFSDTPGKDAVGFRVIQQYDYSRSYLGDTYHQIGDNDSAIKSYKTAIEKNPTNDYLKAQLKVLEKEVVKPDPR
jgi:tetratricopeptide (TPR) repeat protein